MLRYCPIVKENWKSIATGASIGLAQVSPPKTFRSILTLVLLHGQSIGFSGTARRKIFASARQGVINSENPMRDVVLPKGRPAGETHAYSLDEIMRMLNVLPEPAATIVAAAAFTGVRKGELRGFRWENYDGERVLITGSFWRGHALEPKTRQNKSPVPVIATLRRRLDPHRSFSDHPVTGLIFPGTAGKPINVNALAAEVIIPTITKAGIVWHGWHAFRRGLATNLHLLGVPDKTIQKTLRHSNVAVTQSCYIKTPDAEATAAMERFGQFLEYAPNMHLPTGERTHLM